MSSSLIYLFNIYENITAFITILYVIGTIALGVIAVICIITYAVDGKEAYEKIIQNLKKLIKILLVSCGILTIPLIFLPSPKTVAMMYGVEKIKELNVNANISGTQLYKDITTIIHNYATEKKEK